MYYLWRRASGAEKIEIGGKGENWWSGFLEKAWWIVLGVHMEGLLME